MGAWEHFLSFHHHHHHYELMEKYNHDDNGKIMNIPKGCVTIMVGYEDEKQKRFLIPLMYMNHPLFMELLKKAEDEYGFHHQGPIIIPCHVQHFIHVQALIHQDHHHPYHHHHLLQRFILPPWFKS